MQIAHLSDTHVSRYGVPLTGNAQRATAGVQLIPQRDPNNGWNTVQEEDGWCIQLKPRGRLVRGERLRLLCPHGLVHSVLPFGNSSSARETLVSLIRRRRSGAAHTLAAQFPDRARTQALLTEDPDNTNLRLCLAAWSVRETNPDVVVISGDLTEDGIGYELITAAFAPWVARKRLLVVPGNHDLYPSPPFLVAPTQRRTERQKRSSWETFVQSIGRPPGSTLTTIDGVHFALLDSASISPSPHSQTGEVATKELAALSFPDAGLRLAVVHHHVVIPPLPDSIPLQPGMKLRNAEVVMDWARNNRVRAVLNGHRHVTYRHTAERGLSVFSAPSATKGSRSGNGPSYWLLSCSGEEILGAEEILVSVEG